jgi:hypothetical protein
MDWDKISVTEYNLGPSSSFKNNNLDREKKMTFSKKKKTVASCDIVGIKLLFQGYSRNNSLADARNSVSCPCLIS